MAQTAVSWFFDKLKNHEIQAEHFEFYQQAKAMEKEQIQDAYACGSNDRLRNRVIEYYNEKYGGNK
jgi:hypothetical protein